jgi:predicted dehydrogenase
VIFILSPPVEHVRQLERAASLNKAVFIEKPLAVDMDGLRRIDLAVQANPRVYFSDFYVDVRGASLVRAFGSHLDDNRWIASRIQSVEGKPFSSELRERLGPISSIEASLLEGEGEAGVVDSRPWLREPGGGGVLLDLACHHLALYFALFDSALSILDVRLGIHPAGLTGTGYQPWSANEAVGETYALLRLRSTAGFPVRIEVGKNWDADARLFQINALNGTATLDFGTLKGPKNRLLTNIAGEKSVFALDQNYWDMVAEGFCNYFNSGSSKPHGYHEGRAALKTILQAKTLASNL